MPMIPETVVAMLAVMKIGAIISPIFSGFASDAVMTRVQAAGSKMIITADGFSRRGKIVSLKDEVDKACEHCPTVEKLLSFVMQEMILHHITMTFRGVR